MPRTLPSLGHLPLGRWGAPAFAGYLLLRDPTRFPAQLLITKSLEHYRG